MEPKPILWNCTHFRHPTDEQLRHVDIYFLATKIICSLSTLNCCIAFKRDPERLFYPLILLFSSPVQLRPGIAVLVR